MSHALFLAYSFSLLHSRDRASFTMHARYPFKQGNNACHEELGRSPTGNARKKCEGAYVLPRAQTKEIAGIVKFLSVFRFCSRTKHSVFPYGISQN